MPRALAHLREQWWPPVRYALSRLRAPQPNPARLWDRDPAFSALMRSVKPRTLVDTPRCFMLYQLALSCSHLPGDAAEVGVYRGGTARLIAKTLAPAGKLAHLFDTFRGMPRPDAAKDFVTEGAFGDASLPAVQAYLRDCENARFYPGMFPHTAMPLASMRFCFVHVDADIYRSVLDSCAFFYPRLTPSGVMVFDDYGFLGCPGAKLSVDEFFADKPERPWYLPTGQCVVFRRSPG